MTTLEVRINEFIALIDKKDAEIAALKNERNLLRSDLNKVERGYDELAERRNETVAMCDYLQHTVIKRLREALKEIMVIADKGADNSDLSTVYMVALETLGEEDK